MPTMKQVFSSTVSEIGHDPEAQELHVTWKNGKTSVYSGVPADVANSTMNAYSVGQAIKEIKDNYGHRYL